MNCRPGSSSLLDATRNPGVPAGSPLYQNLPSAYLKNSLFFTKSMHTIIRKKYQEKKFFLLLQFQPGITDGSPIFKKISRIFAKNLMNPSNSDTL
jgi:hypothetical protein